MFALCVAIRCCCICVSHIHIIKLPCLLHACKCVDVNMPLYIYEWMDGSVLLESSCLRVGEYNVNIPPVGMLVSISISRLGICMNTSLPLLMILGKHRTNCIETPNKWGKSDNL